MQDKARPYRSGDVLTWLEMTFDERLVVLDAKKFTGYG